MTCHMQHVVSPATSWLLHLYLIFLIFIVLVLLISTSTLMIIQMFLFTCSYMISPNLFVMHNIYISFWWHLSSFLIFFYSWFRYFLKQTHVWFSLIFVLLNIILLFGHSSLTIWTNKSILEVWVSVLIHVHFDSFFSSTRIQFRNQFLYCY